MGKKPGRGSWSDGRWDYTSYPSYPDSTWQFWPGAWSPQEKARQPWTPTARPVFPSYDDQTRVQALAKANATAPIKGKGKGKLDLVTGLEASTDPADAITQFLQESINATRKTEQKVRSLTATKTRKEALWEKYVQDMKQTLQREHQRHQKELDRLSAELHAATQAQETARAHLRSSWEAVAAGGQAPPVAMEAETEGWDSMLELWQAEQQEAVASQAVLRRALGAVFGGDVPGAAAATNAAFHTPPRKGHAAPPLTPPSVTSAAATPPGLSKTTDPYMTSPSQPILPSTHTASDDKEHQDVQASPEAPAKARARPTEARAPIKKLPTGVQHPVPPHTDLADKLHQRRAHQIASMEGAAMHPFRQPPTAPPPASGHDPPPNMLSGCTEVDSDDDMLLPMPPGAKPANKQE